MATIEYAVLDSKSGAELNTNTPDVAFTETDEASSPEMENEISSPSASSPVNVPIAV